MTGSVASRASCFLPLVAILVANALSPARVYAADPPQLWLQVPSGVFLDPLPGYWTTKIEIADINDDGWPDMLFANVGGYQAGTPDSFLSNQAYVNDGEGMAMKFLDASIEVFGEDPNNPGKPSQDTARVIKAADFDGDGDTDIIPIFSAVKEAVSIPVFAVGLVDIVLGAFGDAKDPRPTPPRRRPPTQPHRRATPLRWRQPPGPLARRPRYASTMILTPPAHASQRTSQVATVRAHLPLRYGRSSCGSCIAAADHPCLPR